MANDSHCGICAMPLTDKLAKLLAMCGSDHDGEVLNAARLADRLVRANGTTWHELLLRRPSDPAPRSKPRVKKRTSMPWRELVMICRVHYDELTEWERGFVTSLTYRRSVSKKQYATLARLAGRVRS